MGRPCNFDIEQHSRYNMAIITDTKMAIIIDIGKMIVIKMIKMVLARLGGAGDRALNPGAEPQLHYISKRKQGVMNNSTFC